MSDPVIDLDRVVTRPQLARDLRALGVAPGDALMVHESVKAIGWVAGGFSLTVQHLWQFELRDEQKDDFFRVTATYEF